MKKNVLFAISCFNVGGAEAVLLNLVNNIDRSRFQPFVVSLGSENDPLFGSVIPEVEKVVFARSWKLDLSPSDRIAEFVRERGIDTIVSFNFFPAFFCMKAVKQSKGLRLILALHTTKPIDIKELLQTHVYVRIYPKKYEYLASCRAQTDYLAGRYGIRPARFHTPIYNGVDTAYWCPPPESFRQSDERKTWNIPEDAQVILHVSTFKKNKRHDLMIRAVRRILDADPSSRIVLLLVGGGSPKLESQMKHLAAELNVADRVIFTGRQSNILKFYWLADLFTLASTEVETFSMAALQALSCGLPLALSDIGGAKEMVDLGVTGLLVEPGSVEDLARSWGIILRAPSGFDRRKIRDIAVKRFSTSVFVQNYEALLHSPSQLTGPDK